MADATATPEPASETANEVKIEDVGPARKRLTITIPPEAIVAKLEESIGTLTTETSLPGFRRGKAPRRLLEKRFGTAVRNEAKSQLIADAYAKAIEHHGIEPVGEPEPTEPAAELTIEDGKPLTFALEVEVVPGFELPPLDAIEIKKPLVEITDDLIEDELKRQLLRLGTAVQIDGDFQEGDRLIGHIALTRHEQTEPLFEDNNAVIVCPGTDEGGRGHVLGLMIDGLATMLEDKRVGDTIAIETTGPAAHERDDIRGAKLTLTFRITSAERTEPATVQRMVEAFSLESEDNLREQIKLALQHRLTRQQANAMHQQVYDYLLNAVDFELPEKLSAAQAARTLEGRRIELLYRGLSPEEVEARLAEIRADSESESRNHLKLFFLLRRLADHFKIEVSEQEVNGRLAEIAVQRGQRPEQLRAELAQAGRLDEVARMIRNHKAADRVIASATVKEISADEWNALPGERASAAKAPPGKKTEKRKIAEAAASEKTPPTRK